MSIFLKQDYGATHLTAKQILTDPVLFLAFGFGSGLSKKAPGTLGTLAAVPLYCLLIQTGTWWFLAATILATLVGIPICDKAADRLGVHDFNGIVWDEVAGYFITMLFIPFTWQHVLIGFILFRLFDIFKPWPIKWFDQHVEGGLGIMIDDVVAAVFANLVLVAGVHLGIV